MIFTKNTTMLFLSFFPVICLSAPVNKSPAQITSSINQKISVGAGYSNISEDIIYLGNAILPLRLALNCDGKTGKLPRNQIICTRGLWVDIEATISFNTQTTFDIGTVHFVSQSIKSPLRARCTANTDYKIQQAYYLECVWPSDMKVDVELQPLNRTTIEKQSLTFIAQPTSDYNTEQFKGDIVYQTDFALDTNGYDNSKENTTNINNIGYDLKVISSNFGTPIKNYHTARIISYGSAISTVAIYPDKLDASFSDRTIVQLLNSQLNETGNNTSLGFIYLFYNNISCRTDSSNSVCNQIAKDSTVSVYCDDRNMEIKAIKCSDNSSSCGTDLLYSNIAELQGSWGRVNIDTMCAVTVLLPYE